MAALLSPPLMQVSFAPFGKVVSPPMKPHGDAAQLAVNAGNIFFSQKQVTFSYLINVICGPMQPGKYRWEAFGDARADYVHACRM